MHIIYKKQIPVVLKKLYIKNIITSKTIWKISFMTPWRKFRTPKILQYRLVYFILLLKAWLFYYYLQFLFMYLKQQHNLTIFDRIHLVLHHKSFCCCHKNGIQHFSIAQCYKLQIKMSSFNVPTFIKKKTNSILLLSKFIVFCCL